MYSIGCNVLQLLYTNGKLYFVFWCTIKGTLLVGKTFLTISFIVVMFSNAFCHLNLVSGWMSSHRVVTLPRYGWGEACHTQTLVSFLKHIKLLLKMFHSSLIQRSWYSWQHKVQYSQFYKNDTLMNNAKVITLNTMSEEYFIILTNASTAHTVWQDWSCSVPFDECFLTMQILQPDSQSFLHVNYCK